MQIEGKGHQKERQCEWWWGGVGGLQQRNERINEFVENLLLDRRR